VNKDEYIINFIRIKMQHLCILRSNYVGNGAQYDQSYYSYRVPVS